MGWRAGGNRHRRGSRAWNGTVKPEVCSLEAAAGFLRQLSEARANCFRDTSRVNAEKMDNRGNGVGTLRTNRMDRNRGNSSGVKALDFWPFVGAVEAVPC